MDAATILALLEAYSSTCAARRRGVFAVERLATVVRETDARWRTADTHECRRDAFTYAYRHLCAHGTTFEECIAGVVRPLGDRGFTDEQCEALRRMLRDYFMGMSTMIRASAGA